MPTGQSGGCLVNQAAVRCRSRATPLARHPSERHRDAARDVVLRDHLLGVAHHRLAGRADVFLAEHNDAHSDHGSQDVLVGLAGDVRRALELGGQDIEDRCAELAGGVEEQLAPQAEQVGHGVADRAHQVGEDGVLQR